MLSLFRWLVFSITLVADFRQYLCSIFSLNWAQIRERNALLHLPVAMPPSMLHYWWSEAVLCFLPGPRRAFAAISSILQRLISTLPAPTSRGAAAAYCRQRLVVQRLLAAVDHLLWTPAVCDGRREWSRQKIEICSYGVSKISLSPIWRIPFVCSFLFGLDLSRYNDA